MTEQSERYGEQLDVEDKREKEVNFCQVNLDALFVELTYNLRKGLLDMGAYFTNSSIPEVESDIENSKDVIMQCIENEKERLRECLKYKCREKNIEFMELTSEMTMQYNIDWSNGVATCKRCYFEWDGYAEHCCC